MVLFSLTSKLSSLPKALCKSDIFYFSTAPAPTISMLQSMNPVLWVVVGVVSGVALVGLLLLLVWRLRGGGRGGAYCGDGDEEDTQHSSSGADTEDPKLSVHLPRGKAPQLAPPAPITAHITAQDCLEMDDRNPDVIPLRNGESFL